MAGLELPRAAIREQIASSVHLIVQETRLSDGTRKVTAITEVDGIDDDDGEIELRPDLRVRPHRDGPGGEVIGEFRATGYLPTFLDEFIVRGFVERRESRTYEPSARCFDRRCSSGQALAAARVSGSPGRDLRRCEPR